MFRPLGDRVLIEPIIPEAKTAGGILLPEAPKESHQRGIVIACGPGKEQVMTVKEGDTVLYGEFAGAEIKIEDKTYLLMRESEIFGII